MPAPLLSERVCAELSPLAGLSAAAAAEFCAQGLEAAGGGGSAASRASAWERAASALGVPAEVVAGAVYALTEALLCAARARSTEVELASALAEAGLGEAPRAAVAAFFTQAARPLRALASAGAEAGAAPQFRALDWRLHVTVASRFAHDAMAPGYLLRLDTVAPAAGAASLHATADYAALARVGEALDAAAAELKTAHAKRVLRYIR